MSWDDVSVSSLKLDAIKTFNAGLQERAMPSGCPVCNDSSLVVSIVRDPTAPELHEGWNFPAYAALAGAPCR